MKIKHCFSLLCMLYCTLSTPALFASTPHIEPQSFDNVAISDSSPLDEIIKNGAHILENLQDKISPEYLLFLKEKMARELHTIEPKIQELVSRDTPWNKDSLNLLQYQYNLLAAVNTMIKNGDAYQGMQNQPTPEEIAVSEEYYRTALQFFSDLLAILKKNGIQ